jgi:hypothetical protein
MNSVMAAGTIQQALLTILNLVIAALVSALTALSVSYFRTRGQNLATKHDFDELQKQLSATTKLVETIKSEVSQRDWAQREWTTLRRVKLDALLEKMHECEEYLERRRQSAIDGEVAKPERDPVSEFDVLAAIFPELKDGADRFSLSCSAQLALFSEHAAEVSKIKKSFDTAALQIAYDNFQSKFDYKEFLVTRRALTISCHPPRIDDGRTVLVRPHHERGRRRRVERRAVKRTALDREHQAGKPRIAFDARLASRACRPIAEGGHELDESGGTRAMAHTLLVQ